MLVNTSALPFADLRAAFGERLRQDQPLAPYTSARIGGSADALVEVKSADDLVAAVERLHSMALPFLVLGGGSNVLVSDEGVRQVVILNHAKKVRFTDRSVWAESGANLGAIARQAATKGLEGLEWAAGIPGTLGGAIVGNAGAHGGDIAGSLAMAEILHLEEGRQTWKAHELDFSYRSSWLKTHPGAAIVLAGELSLNSKEEAEIRSQMDSFLAHRRLTQPPGASMGSMFKNPKDDHAGRLIEAAGMKGKRIGNAQISPLHANFFLNLGEAQSADVLALINEAREAVQQQFGVELELEVQLIGDWPQS